MEPSPQGYTQTVRPKGKEDKSTATHSLTGGDLEDLGGEADGALDTELLVLCPVDQVRRDYEAHKADALDSRDQQKRTLLKVLDIAARERDTDFVDLGGGHRGTGRVVFLFTLSDVTHPDACWRVRR